MGRCGFQLNLKEKKLRIDILLKEYSEAQDSAQFHDNLLWVVTSLILTGNMVMIGLIAGNLTVGISPSFDRFKIVIPLIAGFSIVLTVALIIFAREFRRIKKSKYDRCKRIEEQVRELVEDGEIMWQHSSTPQTQQGPLYYLMLVALIAFWGLVLLSVLWPT